ncbi:MAG: sigma-70 family RNA polymerase sigma factor [Bacteroidales bacterium]|nr:sigma-70 family RNA polymerase sigma factor [Bacteroidales bacterium]MDD2426042.1 sigma-70 family RNA polymerase sigma factor [Bacteroidales bacterium]MDD3990298.1 sigma-70 family RNA polymerase sigma factor [Bacteroidales bacterium]
MEEIIIKVREGDQQSFGVLFRAFYASGRRFVLTFLKDETGADDILQEVFINIWEKRQKFQSEAHFKAYFYKSLRNNTIKRIVRTKKGVGLDLIVSKESDDLFEKIIEIEFNRELSRLISDLPEKRRQIILLSMSGMSTEQISESLNISVNTIKSQKNKAYSTLRKNLKGSNSFIFWFLI